MRMLTDVRDGYIRGMDCVSLAIAFIAAGLLVSAVLAICHMIVVRYLLGWVTIWQTEYVTFSVTGSMLLGAPYVLLTQGHVAVTLLPDALGGCGRRVLQQLSAAVSLAFCVLLSYSGWYYLIEAYVQGWHTGTVWGIPLWIPVISLPLGMTLLSLQYIAEMLRPATGEES